MITTESEIIKNFKSTKDAHEYLVREYLDASRQSIASACRRSKINKNNLYAGHRWKYGDENDILGEKWRPLVNVDTLNIEGIGYMASSLGRIIRPNGSKTYGTLQIDNYYYTSIKSKQKRVARLICGAFHGKPLSARYLVNHIDGNKSNNIYTNLEWVTTSENTKHAYDIGLINNNKIYTTLTIPVIQYDRYGNFVSQYKNIREAASITGTRQKNLYQVCQAASMRKDEKSVIDSVTSNCYIWRYASEPLDIHTNLRDAAIVKEQRTAILYLDKIKNDLPEVYDDENIIPKIRLMSKPVIKYDLYRNRLGVYKTVSTAALKLAEEIGGNYRNHMNTIVSCCAKVKSNNTYKGFRWSYFGENLVTISVDKLVIQYTKEGEFVAEYKNIDHVCKLTGYRRAVIVALCNHTTKLNTFKGFRWAYEGEPLSKINKKNTNYVSLKIQYKIRK